MRERKFDVAMNRVIDGDSMDVDIELGFGVVLKNQRIRIAGIDTPELRTRDEREKQFGLMAKTFVIDWCADKVFELIVDIDDERDKFGRILGDFCDVDGIRLSRALIDAHLAVLYEGQNKEEIAKKHLENFDLLTS
jgi:micrococcal nuclease